MKDLRAVLILIATALLIAIILSFAAPAYSAGRWDEVDPETRAWFESLRQPDNPSVSCCGSGDAYFVDELEITNGKVFATITDNRGNPLPLGLKLEIPKHKMNRDPNIMNRYIVFASPDGRVFCFISGTGV